MINNRNDISEFEELLMNSDVRYYLKASPFEAGERSRLDNALTEDYYFDHLYAHSEEAEKKIEEILMKIHRDDVHNYILAGYKGCGKSTFIRYFLRKLDIRYRIINLDDHWEPDKGIINNLVSYLDRLIEDDLFPQNGQQPCRTIRKYIELFCWNNDNKYRIRRIDTENYLIYFGDKIEYTLNLVQSKEYDWLRKYFETDIKIHILKGAEVNGTRMGATISNVLTLILFWDIAYRLANNLSKKCCIVFENLDVIYNTMDIPKLAENVVAFRNNVDKLVPTLSYQGELLPSPTQDYILIFVMRETTEGEFSSYIEHFSDGKVFFQPYTDISNIYDIHAIVSKRADWLGALSEKYLCYEKNGNIRQIQKKTDLILRLLGDPHLRKRLFGFFNDDYRTFVEVLSAIDLEDSKFFPACQKLLALNAKDDDEWSAFGYRSVVYREIFNIFVKEGYINRLRNFEYSERNDGVIRSINLDRMILLYLSNSVTNILVEEDLKEWQFVSLNELFSEVTKFCKKPDSIVDALWQMYDLRRESKWNHLITFDNMREISRKELKSELDAFQNGTSGTEYGRVKITLAGENYLNHVLPHFEYYAARAKYGNGHSLFAFSAVEWCDLEKISTIFKEQRKVIRDCCSRLYRFFINVFDEIPEYKGEAYLQSKFAAIKFSINRRSISRMYHCERIIHSNIGYVNRLRFYVFYIMDQVLMDQGFDEEVEIKNLLAGFFRIDRSLQARWPDDVQPNKITRCILLKKDDLTGEIQRMRIQLKTERGEKELERSLPLSDCIQIIKSCINVKLVDVIINYIRMFGLSGIRGISSEKPCAMHSQSTESLCRAFMACITDVIEPSGYTDFKTSIDASTGNEIIKKNNRKERQRKDKKRHEESRIKYEEMTK